MESTEQSSGVIQIISSFSKKTSTYGFIFTEATVLVKAVPAKHGTRLYCPIFSRKFQLARPAFILLTGILVDWIKVTPLKRMT
jgi:hypothetical protein